MNFWICRFADANLSLPTKAVTKADSSLSTRAVTKAVANTKPSLLKKTVDDTKVNPNWNQLERSTTTRKLPLIQLPKGVTRITESALKGLVKGPVHALAFKIRDRQIPGIDACGTFLAEAYYDIDLRAMIDQLTWQTMLLFDPTTLPWTFTPCTQRPEALAKHIEDNLGCFILNADTVRLKLPVYCCTHKRIEQITQHYSELAWISLMRPSQDIWLDHIISTTTRSHLCHLGSCENPFHSVQEPYRWNIKQRPCHTAALNANANGRTPEQAATFARGKCSHTPKCWPTGAIPGRPTVDNTVSHTRSQDAMKTAGMCCGLDFPVHLGRSLCGTTPLSNVIGRTDNPDFYDLQNYAILTLQFTRPGEWFQAYYNHSTISHLVTWLDPSTARWGIVPQAHP